MAARDNTGVRALLLYARSTCSGLYLLSGRLASAPSSRVLTTKEEWFLGEGRVHVGVGPAWAAQLWYVGTGFSVVLSEIGTVSVLGQLTPQDDYEAG